MQRTLPRLRASWSLRKPNGCCSTSSPVMTATTPGNARAREVSIRTTRACGYFARRIRPCSIPGITRSCRYCVRPVTFSGPSRLGVPLPMTAKVVIVAGAARPAWAEGGLFQVRGALFVAGAARPAWAEGGLREEVVVALFPALSREGAQAEALVEQAGPLVDGGALPDV